MMTSNLSQMHTSIKRAAEWLHQADGLLIGAGAGMGVDSGLPDFRGTTGFWQAYPALGQARIAFEEIANPEAFRRNPILAWGFYGHRLVRYRDTVPHAGFAVLQRFAARLPSGARVFTSNVDGQFQRAGFLPDTVCEVHGSIHHLQCAEPCCDDIWSADAFLPDIDANACRLLSPLPRCPHCGGLARPNILMFGDPGWIGRRSELQRARLDHWLRSVERLAIIELGAGLAVPTVRWFCESFGMPLIRINPVSPDVSSSRAVGMALGAQEALEAIEAALP